jgi:hypothetical protein
VAQLQQALLKANSLLQEMQLIAAPLADPKGWPQQALQSQTVPQRLDSLANVLQNTLKILESGALEVYVRAGKTPLEKTRKK